MKQSFIIALLAAALAVFLLRLGADIKAEIRSSCRPVSRDSLIQALTDVFDEPGREPK